MLPSKIMLTTFGWLIQVVVFHLISQNLHIPSVTLAAFPVQGHSAESLQASWMSERNRAAWHHQKLIHLQQWANREQTEQKVQGGKVREDRICEMHCYPPSSSCYTLISKHVHVIHQSLMLKCTRDERRELNYGIKEWGSAYLHSVPRRSIHKNRYSVLQNRFGEIITVATKLHALSNESFTAFLESSGDFCSLPVQP